MLKFNKGDVYMREKKINNMRTPEEKEKIVKEYYKIGKKKLLRNTIKQEKQKYVINITFLVLLYGIGLGNMKEMA